MKNLKKKKTINSNYVVVTVVYQKQNGDLA